MVFSSVGFTILYCLLSAVVAAAVRIYLSDQVVPDDEWPLLLFFFLIAFMKTESIPHCLYFVHTFAIDVRVLLFVQFLFLFFNYLRIYCLWHAIFVKLSPKNSPEIWAFVGRQLQTARLQLVVHSIQQ